MRLTCKQSCRQRYYCIGITSKVYDSNCCLCMKTRGKLLKSVCVASSTIGLFKMFSRWIWGIFNIQIQSDRGHKLMLFMFQNKDKDLLGIYQYGCDPFCVSLLTDRHLKVPSNSILFTFSDKGAYVCVTRSITRCTQKS